MESYIQANDAEQAALVAAGFTFEYPGVWLRTEQTDAGHERAITIADGRSCNGCMWEVQIAVDDDTQVATEGFSSVEEALAMVDRELAGGDAIDDLFDRSAWPPERRGCPECERSYGPHYTGRCEH
jgi:hypothetical protein